MSIQNFVILILCTHASLDDLMYERKKHDAIAVDIMTYEKGRDYQHYRDRIAGKLDDDIKLMFVFGKNDSVIITEEHDIALVQRRLDAGEC